MKRSGPHLSRYGVILRSDLCRDLGIRLTFAAKIRGRPANRLFKVEGSATLYGKCRDDSGVFRLCVDHITREGYVRLAFDEIRQTRSGSIQLVRKLRSVLTDLLTVVPDDRRAPLERQLELLETAVADNGWPESERAESMLDGDPQGIGSSAPLRRD